MPRVALDTNVLVYAEGLQRTAADEPKVALSRQLLRALVASADPPILVVQALAELTHVLIRRGGVPAPEAAARVRRVAGVGEVRPVTPETLDAALDLAASHNLQIFDALILAAAADARCDLLLSEDLHDGFVWRGAQVVNPFSPGPDRRVARLVAARP